MENRIFNNADSFAMAFDEEWLAIECDDKDLKIEKTIENLIDHPFVIDNPKLAREIAKFRIKSLKKFN